MWSAKIQKRPAITWISKPSHWEEIEEDQLGNRRKIRWSEIWLLDLPTPSNPANLDAHRGILYRRVDSHPDAEVLSAARSLARAINEVEHLAASTGGKVDYEIFASPGESDKVGQLLVGLELVAEWQPGVGEEDIFAHLRHLAPSSFTDAEDDIPFPPADSLWDD